jgi:hypothetical protein
MNKFHLAGYTTVAIFVLLGLLYLRSCTKHILGLKASPSGPGLLLPPKDKEEVLYNSVKHTVTIVTRGKTVTEYAKNPTVELGTNNVLAINRHLMGAECSPFLGLGYGGRANAYLGANGLYLGWFDLGAALAIATNTNARGTVAPVLVVSYNVISNSSLFVGVDPSSWLLGGKPQVHVGLSLKF